MSANLKWKAIFIAAVHSCMFCRFGWNSDVPKSLSVLKSNFANRIKLGLDLQGGTHLILQVQVQEAVSQENRIRSWTILPSSFAIRPFRMTSFAS